jgi:hypothetical protein
LVARMDLTIIGRSLDRALRHDGVPVIFDNVFRVTEFVASAAAWPWNKPTQWCAAKTFARRLALAAAKRGTDTTKSLSA